MEPIDKKETTIQDIKQPASPSAPKHNSLLVILLILLFIAIFAIIGLFYYQNQTKETASTSPTSTETEIPSADTASSVNLDKTVTTDVDAEVKTLDSSMDSQSSNDFSPTDLSDSSLGL